MRHRSIITLTTDFGLADHFVGAMKGVILSINPDAELVDLSHQVSSYDILGTAFTLAHSCRYFPPGTIHLAVVDPGVGTARRAILASAGNAMFVAPDNGVLSLVLDREPDAPSAPAVEVRHITAEHYFLKPVSNTFHGRDVFAPVAAWLSKGVKPEQFGECVTDYVRLSLPRPERLNPKCLRGAVIRIDRFGNVMTNITTADVPELFAVSAPPFKIEIQGREVTRLAANFSAGEPSELIAVMGSSGFVEIAINRGSAAQILGVQRGAPVEVILG
ncbi:MAG TPA: SAM-dependent chlorinase/fluorinase [Terriglobia bacterium]|nr:SAM-dependent chlorinase/fluorinase [Terriglobia bacterium]